VGCDLPQDFKPALRKNLFKMVYKTLKEIRDKAWAEFDKTMSHKEKHGEIINFGGEIININRMCPTSSCNIFHHKDICKFLIKIGQKFTLHHWSCYGRDRYCEFTINKHYLSVAATGIGTGEYITFSKGFPPKLKFQILREMSLDCTYHEIKYKENLKLSPLKGKVLRDLVLEHVRTIRDLKIIARIYHYKSKKKFYEKYKEYKDKEEYKEFKKDWKELQKEKLFKLYEKTKNNMIMDAL